MKVKTQTALLDAVQAMQRYLRDIAPVPTPERIEALINRALLLAYNDGSSAKFVEGSDTSALAAKKLRPHLGRVQREVLSIICDSRLHGVTGEEIDAELNARRGTNTPSPGGNRRPGELIKMGYAYDTGLRRRARSGLPQRVVCATEEGFRLMGLESPFKESSNG